MYKYYRWPSSVALYPILSHSLLQIRYTCNQRGVEVISILMFRPLILLDLMLKGLDQLVKRTIQGLSRAPTASYFHFPKVRRVHSYNCAFCSAALCIPFHCHHFSGSDGLLFRTNEPVPHLHLSLTVYVIAVCTNNWQWPAKTVEVCVSFCRDTGSGSRLGIKNLV